MYFSTKTYDHSNGWSCAFRQWRATSRCRLIHGYSMAVQLKFATDTLDERNWVQDFGGLKDVKKWLVELFDHTTVVAEDDPDLGSFVELKHRGLVDLRVLPNVGCEAFAKTVYDYVAQWLQENNPRVYLVLAEVREHAGNSASYVNPDFATYI